MLEDNLAATPEQMGDPSKETKEELTDRHERALAATVLALAALAGVAAQPPGAADKMAGTLGKISATWWDRALPAWKFNDEYLACNALGSSFSHRELTVNAIPRKI